MVFSSNRTCNRFATNSIHLYSVLSYRGNLINFMGFFVFESDRSSIFALHRDNTKMWSSISRILRNPGRDISFPFYTRKEIETKRIRKEIKTIISRLNHFLSFIFPFQYIAEKKLKQVYWIGNQNKKYLVLST